MSQKPVSQAVAVACHDAGGANQIFAYLAAQKLRNSKAYIKGPALILQEKYCLNIKKENSLEAALNGAKLLISGTGWQSDLEHDARKLAKLRQIKTVALIDHWTNYEDRFIRKGEIIHPDEIWVTDPYARKLALNFFHNIPVKQIPNYYLQEKVFRIMELSSSCTGELLYILEPARNTWGRTSQGEFQALDFFIRKLTRFDLPKPVNVVLRSHPSDPKGKYDAWISKYQNLFGKSISFTLQGDVSLEEAIARASFVIGCESYALTIALAAGKKVYCSLPPWAPKCRLPHKGIIPLEDL